MNTFTESILDMSVDSASKNAIDAALVDLLSKYNENITFKASRNIKPGYDIAGNKYEEGDWAILFQGTLTGALAIELARVIKNKNNELIFVGWNRKAGKIIKHTGGDWWWRSVRIDDIEKFMKKL